MQDKKSEMLSLIAQWESSGLNQSQFCIKHNVAYHIFQYWNRVHKADKQPPETLIPLKIKTASTPDIITITGTNGIILQMPMTTTTLNLLKQLLQA